MKGISKTTKTIMSVAILMAIFFGIGDVGLVQAQDNSTDVSSPEPTIVSSPEPTIVSSPEPTIVSSPEPTINANPTINVPIPIPSPTSPTTNYTKLEIVPQYGNIRLKPGESKEVIVTVRNRNEQSVNIIPRAEILNGYVDMSWVTINPSNIDLLAGENKQFTINVSAPNDAAIGYSSVQIIFTEDILPTSYPQQTPVYVNAFQLQVEIYTPPKLQIETSYINGQLESGKKYEYDIKVKNIADHMIGISPRLGDEYFGGGSQANLDKNSITIQAPQNISAGATETIKIIIKVPDDVRGYYNNYVDLGPDDPSITEGTARISLSLNIWKQPKESFVKNFELDKKSQITVEISSSTYNYPEPNNDIKEPSFDTSIIGPDGESDLSVTKTVTKGNVNMGGDIQIFDNKAGYQDTGTQYIYTYKTDGSPGKWKLKVLPKNAPSFEYSITTENK